MKRSKSIPSRAYERCLLACVLVVAPALISISAACSNDATRVDGSGGGRDGSSGDGDGDTGDGDGDGDGDGAVGDGDGDGDGAVGDGDGDTISDAGLIIPADCVPPAVNMPPQLLSCTGLYTDIEAKEVADVARPFTPGVQLWSDGADKLRWIYLPPGTQIDTSNPDSWIFPIGTKFWKEFSWKGHRVETRLFQKETDTLWLKTSYHWDQDETEATRFAGGEVDVAGDTYYIPNGRECEQCHKGRDDRALGFEALLLGLPDARGLTLARLADEGLISDDSFASNIEIGDDGTGKAAAALGWLHVNCGVSCHNGYTGAEAYRTDMYLQLKVSDVDGSSVGGVEPINMTVGVGATTPRWTDRTRITAGSPTDSLLYFLLSTRDAANPKDQMPPIASRVVDEDGAALVEDWIRSLSAP